MITLVSVDSSSINLSGCKLSMVMSKDVKMKVRKVKLFYLIMMKMKMSFRENPRLKVLEKSLMVVRMMLMIMKMMKVNLPNLTSKKSRLRLPKSNSNRKVLKLCLQLNRFSLQIIQSKCQNLHQVLLFQYQNQFQI